MRVLSRRIKAPGPGRGTLRIKRPHANKADTGKPFTSETLSFLPGPSPRGPPGQATANKLQLPGDMRSGGDSRTPQSSPSPAHPGERHLHREGGVDGRRGRREEVAFKSKFTVRHVCWRTHAPLLSADWYPWTACLALLR